MREKGLTLIEMIMVVAIIAIIAIGLNSFFINTMRAFWKTENQIEVHREAEFAGGILTDDLREVRKATVNNIISNPGFTRGVEFPTDTTDLQVVNQATSPNDWTWQEGNADGTVMGKDFEDHDGINNFWYLNRSSNEYDTRCVMIRNLTGRRYEWRARTQDICEDATGIIFGGWAKAEDLNFVGTIDNDTHLRLVVQLNNNPNNEYYIDWPLEFEVTNNTYFIVPYQYVKKVLTEDVVGEEILSVTLIGRVSGASSGVVYFDNFYLSPIIGGNLNIADGDTDIEKGEGSFRFRKCVDPMRPKESQEKWETYTMDRTWEGVRKSGLVKRISERGSGYINKTERTPRFTPSRGGVEIYIPFNKETGRINAPLEIKTRVYPRAD